MEGEDAPGRVARVEPVGEDCLLARALVVEGDRLAPGRIFFLAAVLAKPEA